MCLIGRVAGVTQSDSKHDPFSFDQLGILERDVAIIRGESADTYAAIRLRQLGKGFVVIEKEDRLGGHSNAYSYTATGIPVPYGVMSFLNKGLVTDYFSHFNISLVNKITVTNQSENVDFATGEPIAVKPITIPSDDPATFSPDVIYGIQHGFLNLPSHDNSVLYRAAEKELGHDVLYKSRVISAMRGLSEMDNSSYILAQTPSGQKPIHAKNILIAVPQTIENLMPLALIEKEGKSSHSLPAHIGVYRLVNTCAPGLNWVLYGSSTFMRNEEAKKDIVDSVLLIRHPNVTVIELEIVAFRSYSLDELIVFVQAIQGGFNTGAALTAHESHLL
ncbi:hypothetical protein BDV39DRAFT_199628 [Aspergillus sergii]|uniref:Amine oxidase domain-containing protein n=1 Tax=Aspergillus sergii TaxID=1034303 RepID=A0A5N6XJ47_9EURO|nr:hypothetical protein BDV39DRAFT_199628 [Aspergillus sergii]